MTDTCKRCGIELKSGERLCTQCGAMVEARQDARRAPEVTGTIHSLGTTTTDSGPLPTVRDEGDEDVPPGMHVLVVARGPSMGMRLELTESPTTVGRSVTTAIFLDDITVSREHAQFETSGDGWALRDLGSLNGTYVNRQAIERQDLVSGDEIQIGKYRFRYLAGK